jgi:hypothetical protein
MIVDTMPRGIDSRLSLFMADSLKGPWCEHYQNLIVNGDPNIARPGGRVLKYDGKLYRLSQDCYPEYGLSVNAFEILELTPTIYREKPYSGNPILEGSGKGWNKNGMHHIDAHMYDEKRWIACVDGWYMKEM